MSFATSSSELQTVPTATIQDLDLDAFDAFLAAKIPRLAADEVTHEEALIRTRLASTMGNRIVPTYAGLYLFGRDPQWLLPQLGVVAAHFDGIEITDEVLIREHLEGPFPTLVDQALAFIEAHAERVINQVDPDDQPPEFPLAAAREAIVNALVHRDLKAGGPVALRLFDDRLEIFSPGPPNGLPEAISRYMASGGISLPRNPLLATMARQLGYVEQLGRGLPTIRKVVQDELHIDPVVAGSKEGVLVIIPSAFVAQKARTPELAN